MIGHMLRLFLIAFLLLPAALLSVEEISNAKPEYITEYYQKALASYNAGKYEDSLNHIRHVIKSNMRDYRLRYLASHNHWRNKNYDSAVIHMQTAMAIEPLKASPYVDLALIYTERKSYYRARELALSGINKLQQNNVAVPPKLFNIAARMYLINTSYRQALGYAQKAKSAFKKLPADKQNRKDEIEAIILEGRSHLAMANYEGAELAFSWAIDLEKKINGDASAYTYNLLGYLQERWANSGKLAAQKAASMKASAAKNYGIAASRGSGRIKQIAQQNLNRVK